MDRPAEGGCLDVVCDSGRVKQCAFCPSCGTRIYHAGEWGVSVKAGTLDDTSGLDPSAHYWTSRKQAWLEIPESMRSFREDG